MSNPTLESWITLLFSVKQAEKHLQRTVELLQKNNVGVVICDERELNAIRIREEKQRAQAIAAEKQQANRMGKGKQKVTCADKRKDNALVQVSVLFY
ncbi:hypothetical protein RHSIM_Rhsim11G0025600 [Rhododendron simsii]|uniref:Uncharacterized protein n=1 Tax=Rhododendron simsii TaxID=118357 RepID=A0A834GCE3_RHOSS|nr:hypothetical protein RHSIM_Rhsim11G0025600 [Rhododendron simsii]